MLSLIHAGFECSDHCRKSYAGYVCFLQCHYLHSYKSCENIKYTIFYFDLLICQAHGFDDKDFTLVCFLKSHSLNYKK